MSETLSAEELENTVWIDDDGYPTEAALEAVATLPSPQVFEVMRRAWWMPTHGVRNDLSAAEAGMVGELEGTPWRFATGGWSGNEELIDSFQESWTWRWTWRLTATGGLYIFEVPSEALPGGRVAPLGKAATIEALQAEVTTLRTALEAQRSDEGYQAWLREKYRETAATIAQQTETIRGLKTALLTALHAVHDLSNLKPHTKHGRWQDCPDAVCRGGAAALTSTEAKVVELKGLEPFTS